METWGKLALGKNEYLGKWVLEENIDLGKLGTGKMGTGANGLQGKWTFGERGTLSAPVFLCPFPLCLQMGTGANGHLGQMSIWGKGYSKFPKGVPQVPWAHYPKC